MREIVRLISPRALKAELPTPEAALALHAELYDRAPASDATTPVAGLPVVTLDGTALRGQDGTALADALQERLTR